MPRFFEKAKCMGVGLWAGTGHGLWSAAAYKIGNAIVPSRGVDGMVSALAGGCWGGMLTGAVVAPLFLETVFPFRLQFALRFLPGLLALFPFVAEIVGDVFSGLANLNLIKIHAEFDDGFAYETTIPDPSLYLSYNGQTIMLGNAVLVTLLLLGYYGYQLTRQGRDIASGNVEEEIPYRLEEGEPAPVEAEAQREGGEPTPVEVQPEGEHGSADQSSVRRMP
jgi:hypothetical protein